MSLSLSPSLFFSVNLERRSDQVVCVYENVFSWFQSHYKGRLRINMHEKEKSTKNRTREQYGRSKQAITYLLFKQIKCCSTKYVQSCFSKNLCLKYVLPSAKCNFLLQESLKVLLLTSCDSIHNE